MGIKEVKTDQAPQAIGPYSQAVIAGDYVFVSGQIPLDPKTGEIVSGIKEQTTQVLRNLEAVLRASGTILDRVVKTTVYLADMGHFKEMNDVYASFFGGSVKPARETVQVSRLPRDVLVEISCVAYRG